MKVDSSLSFRQSRLGKYEKYFVLSSAFTIYGIYELIKTESFQSYFYLGADLAGKLNMAIFYCCSVSRHERLT